MGRLSKGEQEAGGGGRIFRRFRPQITFKYTSEPKCIYIVYSLYMYFHYYPPPIHNERARHSCLFYFSTLTENDILWKVHAVCYVKYIGT